MRRFSFLAALLFLTLCSTRAFADASGTSVTGSLTFNGFSTNYFNPANGHVPGGYGNSGGTVATIGSGVEFGFQDTANLDTADFTGTSLTITDMVHSGGSVANSAFAMTFTDPAFTFVTLSGSNVLGLTYSISGDTLTFNYAGGTVVGTESSTFSLVPVATTPEPSSFALLGTGVLGVAGAFRRRLLS